MRKRITNQYKMNFNGELKLPANTNENNQVNPYEIEVSLAELKELLKWIDQSAARLIKTEKLNPMFRF